MKIYIFGNGNIPFRVFQKHYEGVITHYLDNRSVQFILCDFRGVDTLAMELLKTETKNVSIYHIGEHPRYLPDRYRTKVSSWELIGGFESDRERDDAAIDAATHFIAVDFNSDSKRKSGTLRNIKRCLELGKIELKLERVE